MRIRFSASYLVFIFLLNAAVLSQLAGCGRGKGNFVGGGGDIAPSFTLSLTSASINLAPTRSQSSTVSLIPANGFSGTANCKVEDLPAGVSLSPQTFTISATQTQKMQISMNNNALPGSSTASISCTGGSANAATQFNVIVNDTKALSLSIKPTSITLFPGGSESAVLYINGTGGLSGTANGTITGLPAGVTVNYSTFSTVVNSTASLGFTAASNAAASSTAVITVKSGTYSATLKLKINVITKPDFTISTGIYTEFTIDQSSTGTFTVSTTDYNGFNQPVKFSFTGIPAGVTFTPSTFTLLPGATQQVTVEATFSAVINNSGYGITLTGIGGGVINQSNFTMYVNAPLLEMVIQPMTLNLPVGSTSSINLGFVGLNGNPQGSINVTSTTPPSGVTVSPSSYSFVLGESAPPIVYIIADSTAKSGSVTFTATYGPYTQTGTVNIQIGAGETDTSVPLSTNDQLVHGDALTPYLYFPQPNYLVYNPNTNRFFSSDAYLNQLNVIDGSSHELVTTLEIPGAFGIDESATGTIIYVGTMAGDLYEVDAEKLTIIKRIPSNSISDYGFTANAVYALASGDLLLVNYFLVPGFSWVDGNGPMAIWNPTTNQIKLFENPPNNQPGVPTLSTCLQRFSNIMLTNNRSRVLLVPVATDEGSTFLCTLDPIADTWVWSGSITAGTGSVLQTFALTPDGNTLVTFDGYDIFNLDPSTLAIKNQFSVTAGTNVPSINNIELLLSSDGTKVYITDIQGEDILDVYDLASGKEIGWIPQTNNGNADASGAAGPIYQGITSNGLAAGVLPYMGVGLLDTTAIKPMPVGTHMTQTQLYTAYGPLSGGTATEWYPNDRINTPPVMGSIYFGSKAATHINNDGYDGTLNAVTPAGSAGPVDVRTFTPDGGSQFNPWGFSYGPWILEAATGYATAEGGGPGSIYGLGYGPVFGLSSASYVEAPPDLEVKIGESSATPLLYMGNLTNVIPSNALLYKVPQGSEGASESIEVTNNTGSVKGKTQLTYLPKTQQLSVDGQLVDGVYDSKRNLYYLTDTTEVRIYSPTQNIWLTPIKIPQPKGAYGAEQLFGIGISQDCSKLVVTDSGSIAVYLINLNNGNTIQSFPYANYQYFYSDPKETIPGSAVVTNTGTVYFITYDVDGDGANAVWVLDPSTGSITQPDPSINISGDIDDYYARIVMSSDQTRVYFTVTGLMAYYDVASQSYYYSAPNLAEIDYGNDELVLAPNDQTVYGNGYVMDSNLNTLGLQALDVAESVDAEYVYGSATSADGSLIFQPGDQFIDVYNGYTGSFITRVSLPQPLSPNFRALIGNQIDSQILAITGETGNGVMLINLNSIPEPPPVYHSLSSQRVRGNNVRPPSLAEDKKTRTAIAQAVKKNRLMRYRKGTLLQMKTAHPTHSRLSSTH